MCLSFLSTLKLLPYSYKTWVAQTDRHTRLDEHSQFLSFITQRLPRLLLCFDIIRNLIMSLFLLMMHDIFFWLVHYH